MMGVGVFFCWRMWKIFRASIFRPKAIRGAGLQGGILGITTRQKHVLQKALGICLSLKALSAIGTLISSFAGTRDSFFTQFARNGLLHNAHMTSCVKDYSDNWLKVYSPVNRTGSPQGFSQIKISHKLNTIQNVHVIYKRKYQHIPKVSTFGIVLVKIWQIKLGDAGTRLKHIKTRRTGLTNIHSLSMTVSKAAVTSYGHARGSP